MLTLRAHTFLQTETEVETLEGDTVIRMMERQFTNINLIEKLVKLDDIRKVKNLR